MEVEVVLPSSKRPQKRLVFFIAPWVTECELNRITCELVSKRDFKYRLVWDWVGPRNCARLPFPVSNRIQIFIERLHTFSVEPGLIIQIPYCKCDLPIHLSVHLEIKPTTTLRLCLGAHSVSSSPEIKSGFSSLSCLRQIPTIKFGANFNFLKDKVTVDENSFPSRVREHCHSYSNFTN
jgi:hypothetical protein